ncbi:MAG: aminopeptidase, partial [Erysipelotrichaceae bacterium]|nr:aminopeptidase [Erysipelotrichaceae bacterium]
GIAYASFPLMMSGKLVKDFWIRFKDGKAIDCGASENVEMLKDALFKDETTRQLGEVALVSKQSPIRKLGRIFYNGLIDENAACHLAFGSSFPDCVKGGTDMSEEELKSIGVNFSVSHNDFMIGTDDIKVVGITHEGKEVTVMEHGDFVI